MNECQLIGAIADLEELLDEEIPCGGISHPVIRRSCTRSAVLRSNNHGCPVNPPLPLNKCISCWQIWYRYHMGRLNLQGYLQCKYCDQKFPTIEDFSDYRPL